jgi:chitodextrinase
MSEITYAYDSVVANVKDYRGYTDFIYSIYIKMSATDGTYTVTHQKNYELDVDKTFTDEDPFVPFNQWNAQKVNEVADQLTYAAKTREQLARLLKIESSQPKPKNFSL